MRSRRASRMSGAGAMLAGVPGGRHTPGLDGKSVASSRGGAGEETEGLVCWAYVCVSEMVVVLGIPPHHACVAVSGPVINCTSDTSLLVTFLILYDTTTCSVIQSYSIARTRIF